MFTKYAGVTSNRPLRRSLVSYIVCETGDGFTAIALPLFVLERGGSAFEVGLTFAANISAATVAALFGGPLVDRFDRRTLVITSFALRAVLLLAAGFMPGTASVIGLAVLAGMLGAIDNPAMEAAVLEMAGDDVAQVSAVRNLGYSAASAVGPAVAGGFIAVTGAQTAILVNATTFVLALLLLARVREFDVSFAERRLAASGAPRRSLSRTIGSGFASIHSTPALRRYVYYCFFGMVAVAVALVTLPIYVLDTLEASEFAYGLTIAAYSVGCAVSLFFYGTRTLKNLERVLLVSGLLYGVTAIGVGAVAIVPLVVALRLVWGWAFGPEQIAGDVLVMRHTDRALLGRVYTAQGVFVRLGSVVGFLGAGSLITLLGARTTLVATGVFFTVLAFVFFARPALRANSVLEPEPTAATATPEVV